MAEISIPLFIDLHMSYKVSAAVETAAKASISTPVFEVVSTVAMISTSSLDSGVISILM